MAQSIAFHSYKGGTGKSTIAANLAAKLATEGYNVSLLDLDVYAPSLQVYFDYTPKKWINDLLSDKAQLSDIMVDMTSVVKPLAGPDAKIGKLWLGFSNPQKEEIYKLEGGIGKQKDSKIQLLRKFIQLREDLITKHKCDYIIIDTSPGIRFWSINSLALADTILLILKFGDLDIEGTKKMAADMYDSFTKYGAKSYLLLNRVAGYCIPDPSASTHFHHEQQTHASSLGSEFGSTVSKEVGMDMISAVPCYCDIQFSRKEFLTALQHPEHPFAKQLHMLAESRPIKNDQ
jgi:MinD-like ATPase involved in chromosome partitioning or flagellar assembly